jgi:SRSO17 transposase
VVVGFLAWVTDAVRPPRQGLLLVRDNKPAAVAAVGSVVDPGAWATECGVVAGMISDRFARPEAAGHAMDLVSGLVSELERKNCWTIAERAGHRSPHAFQHLLARAVWDTDGVRDDLRCYATQRLMTPGELGVLVVDETGDLKKGTDRRQQAGVPDDVTFATKPALAAEMITRALTGGVPVGWVTGDEVYGACPNLRATIRSHGLGYVLAIASNHRLTYPGADEADLAADLARTSLSWQRLSAGAGAKGHRYYSGAPRGARRWRWPGRGGAGG